MNVCYFCYIYLFHNIAKAKTVIKGLLAHIILSYYEILILSM
jgi:hypothetical protein